MDWIEMIVHTTTAGADAVSFCSRTSMSKESSLSLPSAARGSGVRPRVPRLQLLPFRQGLAEQTADGHAATVADGGDEDRIGVGEEVALHVADRIQARNRNVGNGHGPYGGGPFGNG